MIKWPGRNQYAVHPGEVGIRSRQISISCRVLRGSWYAKGSMNDVVTRYIDIVMSHTPGDEVVVHMCCNTGGEGGGVASCQLINSCTKIFASAPKNHNEVKNLLPMFHSCGPDDAGFFRTSGLMSQWGYSGIGAIWGCAAQQSMIFASPSLQERLHISVSIWNREYFSPIPTLNRVDFFSGQDRGARKRSSRLRPAHVCTKLFLICGQHSSASHVYLVNKHVDCIALPMTAWK